MAVSPEFVAHCIELLSPLGPARSRRMFGGHGFYVDDVFVALIFGERLYLKADATTQARFEAADCEIFVYHGADKPVSMNYWTAPDDAMESPMLMLPWARLAMEAALRARNAKPAKRAKKLSPPPPTKPKAAAKKAQKT